MVVFVCNACGSSIKKNKVEKHFQTECPDCSVLSCIDCGQDFVGDAYQQHTSCITEAEKYQGKLFKDSDRGKPSKGEQKQLDWTQRIQEIAAAKRASGDPKIAQLLETIATYHNVPRKKAKFENFVSNSLNVHKPHILGQLWEAFADAAKQQISGCDDRGGDEEGSASGCGTTSHEPTSPAVEASEEGEKRRKKKRKHKDEEDNSEDVGTVGGRGADASDCGDVVDPHTPPPPVKKKKKKKTKEPDPRELDTAVSIPDTDKGECPKDGGVPEPLSDANHDPPKKKKKRRKESEPQGLDASASVAVDDKGECPKDGGVPKPLSDANHDTPKKKRKKRKESEPQGLDASASVAVDDKGECPKDGGVPKPLSDANHDPPKKKKKKRKESEPQGLDASASVAVDDKGECPKDGGVPKPLSDANHDPPKKKKRKAKASEPQELDAAVSVADTVKVEHTQDGDVPDHLSDPNPSRKKKKKKTKESEPQGLDASVSVAVDDKGECPKDGGVLDPLFDTDLDPPKKKKKRHSADKDTDIIEFSPAVCGEGDENRTLITSVDQKASATSKEKREGAASEVVEEDALVGGESPSVAKSTGNCSDLSECVMVTDDMANRSKEVFIDLVDSTDHSAGEGGMEVVGAVEMEERGSHTKKRKSKKRHKKEDISNGCHDDEEVSHELKAKRKKPKMAAARDSA